MYVNYDYGEQFSNKIIIIMDDQVYMYSRDEMCESVHLTHRGAGVSLSQPLQVVRAISRHPSILNVIV